MAINIMDSQKHLELDTEGNMEYVRRCGKKMWCIYMYVYYMYTHTMKYYLVIKKNEILPPAATWMDPENIIPSEVSQTEKDKYYIIPLICRI